ncbi:transmembrane protein 170A-like isoform X2 [Babylonia areolata]|uniref:transmembrane protein 170A-like isoform X2 n=1 Tax=Babylonia areolata TaxID=304850 RepID=UPI003FD29AB2
MGIISPLTGGVISSAAVAGVYRASDFAMMPFYALVWGVGQTVMMVVISFSPPWPLSEAALTAWEDVPLCSS